jgi:hypothetical protein
MKIIIRESLGNVSKSLTKQLRKQGNEVTVKPLNGLFIVTAAVIRAVVRGCLARLLNPLALAQHRKNCIAFYQDLIFQLREVHIVVSEIRV